MKNRPRMCLVCRERAQKDDLFRFVKVEGKLTFDESKKKQSRGSWVCKKRECLQKLEKKCKIEHVTVEDGRRCI